jgi:F-box protein 18 (helicase)
LKKDIKPTDEQKKILEAMGRVIKINARAGTGKTTTLRLIAENNPDQKILYLVFNRKNREEAEKVFPRNVKIRSVHAFALASLSSLGKKFDIDRNFSACKFLPDFEGERDRQTLATFSYNFMMFFLNSRFEKLEEAIDPYCEEHLNDEQRKIFARHKNKIVEIARRLSTFWNTCEKPCPDDFYLKLSHLKKTFHRELEKFDLILVDEGQDLSQVMVDALMHCTKRIVLVGDTHQGIYSFRYAVDAMRLLNSDQEFDLSLSFRFGEEIAALATHFIAESKGETHFRIRGNKMQRSTISFYSDLSFLKRGTRTAILSRTNMGLFKNAMHMRAKRQSFCFERDIKVELMKTLDVYRLHCGEKEKICDELIQSFDSLAQLNKYAEQIQNFQLSNISQIVKQYASEFPGAIFEMIKLTKENGDQNDREAVILSTVHTAKGQEYERVIIDADIAEAINRTAGKNAKEFHDEVNVAYVCLTRVKGQLFLPMVMKTLLTPTWRHYMEGLIPKVSTLYIAGKNDGKKYGAEPKTSRFSKRSAVPNQLTYSVGDRVRTSNGYGTIVAIVGAQYHIALEGQVARMRENLTALNFYNH